MAEVGKNLCARRRHQTLEVAQGKALGLEDPRPQTGGREFAREGIHVAAAHHRGGDVEAATGRGRSPLVVDPNVLQIEGRLILDFKGDRLLDALSVAERKMERALIGEFEQTVDQLLGGLSGDNVPLAAEIAGLYLDIRGYGPVKAQAADEVRAEILGRLAEFANHSRKAA